MATGSGAGLNRVHKSTTLAASGDSGAFATEAKFWTKWTFMVSKTGTVTTPQITFYGTTDPNTASGSASNWSVLVAPAEQTGTGSVVNPITATDGTQMMQFSGPLLAVRITTNAFTGGGSVTIDTLVTP